MWTCKSKKFNELKYDKFIESLGKTHSQVLKYKKKNVESSKTEMTSHVQRCLIKLTASFSETVEARKESDDIFKFWKIKKNSLSGKLCFKIDNEI